MRIRLFRADVPERATVEVAEVLRSGWLGSGSRTFDFEQAFARHADIAHCVGVASGTAALHLSLQLLGLPEGAEVVTTPNTFVATNHAILYSGATPVFADIDAGTGNISAGSIEASISERTKAIMIVHFGGCPCDIDPIYEVAGRHRLPVIEDCSHAIGATYQGRTIGSHGDIHAFSLGPTKNIATPGGGVVTVRSAEHDARLRRLRMLGVDKDSFTRSREGSYNWEYDVVELGYRANMNEVTAVVARTQLEDLDDRLARRAAIATRYVQRLVKVPGVTLPSIPDDRTVSNYMFWALVDERDSLIKRLAGAGIESSVFFKRNDLYPMFDEADVPTAEMFWRRQIALPMHTQLTDDEVDAVCDEIEAGW